jgi:hypothetical protein
MSQQLDRWNADGVRFILGYDGNPTFKSRADGGPIPNYSCIALRTKGPWPCRC